MESQGINGPHLHASRFMDETTGMLSYKVLFSNKCYLPSRAEVGLIGLFLSVNFDSQEENGLKGFLTMSGLASW
jgi:hypothetical protein